MYRCSCITTLLLSSLLSCTNAQAFVAAQVQPNVSAPFIIGTERPLVASAPPETVPAASTAFTDDKLLLKFPQVLGGLSFSKHLHYPQTGLGYSLRYGDSDLMWVDIYVYDRNLNDIPSGYTDKTIISELANAEAAIQFAGQIGRYLDVTKITEGIYPQDPKRNSVAFRFSQFQYRLLLESKLASSLMTSEIFICGYKKHFIKVRVTYPESSVGSSNKSRNQLINQLAELLKAT